jgi:hypothetical protein
VRAARQKRASGSAARRQAQDRRIAEQVAQERLHRLERIGPPRLNRMIGDLHRRVDGFQLRTISTSCGDVLRRRLRHHAVAEIEASNEPWPSLSRMRVASRSMRGRPHQHDRIEIALHADVRLQLARRPVCADAGVDRQGGKGVAAAIHQGRRARRRAERR